MARSSLVACICLILTAIAASFLPAGMHTVAAQQAPAYIFLRRGTFDPLTNPPAQAASRSARASTLLLVQLDGPPDAAARARLEAAGLQPLVYIPDNTFLVRTSGVARSASAAVAGMRWSGMLDPAAKLEASLDAALSGPATDRLDLRVVATPDADVNLLTSELGSLGASVIGRSSGRNGSSLHVVMPAGMVSVVQNRDDVLWIERFFQQQLLNDQTHTIVGVGSLPERLWLDGTGQTVAVTDSGLDVQTSLSADFAGRIATAFANRDMVDTRFYPTCTGSDWSDRNGHGTHVSGSILGSGALSGGQFAGIAPGARLVVQNTSSGGTSLDCFPEDTSYLQSAYDAGARIQNGSFGAPSGGGGEALYGGYTVEAQDVDSFLWEHPDHLFVVAAGNEGVDANADGIIDDDAINSPGTAKNVVTVGASENLRPPTGTPCVTFTPNNLCWRSYGYMNSASFLANDPVSDNPNGLAAFSSRGPADDGRIKPEIVAPGTNVISSRSHASGAHYTFTYNADYAYSSGTSMATPLISGLAALTRQWLIEVRGEQTPTAALLKALLLNGATNIGPGQYASQGIAEVGPEWPNNAEGWGRAAFTDTIGLGGEQRVWFAQDDGLETSDLKEYRVAVAAGEPLRVTLGWTDYPGSPVSARALVDNLDLEVVLPDGVTTLKGNADAALPADCRDADGADTCNPVESVLIQAPQAGIYTLRVRAASVSPLAGKQPFALVARAAHVDDADLAVPALQPIANSALASVNLSWSAVDGIVQYKVEQSATPSFDDIRVLFVDSTNVSLIQQPGTSYYRVRACHAGGCSSPSATRQATTILAPYDQFLPITINHGS